MKDRFTELQHEFGSLYRLAKILDLTPNAIYNWKRKNDIPVKHIRKICVLSENRITRQFLRPDIFGE